MQVLRSPNAHNHLTAKATGCSWSGALCCWARNVHSNSERDNPDWRIMDSSVPMRSSLWSGTGTVTVDIDVFRCIAIWLPRFLTSTKPCFSRIWQTSFPERTRSLPNGYLHVCDIDLLMQSSLDFFWGGCFKKKFQCLLKVFPGFIDSDPLTCNIQLRTQSDVSVIFPLNNCSKLLGHNKPLTWMVFNSPCQ